MKAKFTILRMHFLLMRHSNDKGFALPIAMGMGLFLLLVSMMMMFRSQGDRVTASTQKSISQGLNAAETGVTRYQNLINNNRTWATYANTSWSTAPSSSGCSSDTTSNITTIAGTGWQDIDSSDASKGQYKLVSYAFTANTTIAPNALGKSTLIVEGRVNQRGSGSTATKDIATSNSRLKVEIPVFIGDISNHPVPGLWLKTGDTGGKNEFDGNVLLTDCNSSASLDNVKITTTSSVTGLANTKLKTSLSFPNLPTKPSSFPTSNTLGNHTGNLTLPRSSDVSTTETINGVSSKVYRYSVNSIDLSQGNSTLTVNTGDYNPSNGNFNTGQLPVKVYFYLEGNIEKGGDIIHGCSFTTGTKKSTTTVAISNCKPTDFQIFGYGASSNKICMNGNGKIEAFIFAPNYMMGVAGSGGGAGGLKGSAWVNSWSDNTGCGSNTSNTVLVQTASWEDIGLTPSNLPPRLGNITKWERQEAGS